MEQENLGGSDIENGPDEKGAQRVSLGEDVPAWLIRDAKIFLIETSKSQLKNGLVRLSSDSLPIKDFLNGSAQKVANILNPTQLHCVQGELLNETSDWLSKRAQEWKNRTDRNDISRK